MKNGKYCSNKGMNKKPLALLLALTLLVTGVVGGTIAWLTAESETVENTFTVGDINISIDETGAVNNQKDYKIVPGGEADKDPKITVAVKSEKCYVYACVTNTVKLDGEVVATPNISDTDWEVVTTKGDATLYRYKGAEATEGVVDAMAEAVELSVFTKVTYADTITKDDIDDLENTKITIKGYAHQSDNTTRAAADTAAKDAFGLN